MLLDRDEIPFATADVALCCAFDRMLLQAPVGSDALLDVQSGHKVIELGPGHGFSLRIILRKQPEYVYAIEVSESFRSLLASDPYFSQAVESRVLTIRGDTGPRYPDIPSASIDRILGMNVLTFLNPLRDYVDEVYRVAKMGLKGAQKKF